MALGTFVLSSPVGPRPGAGVASVGCMTDDDPGMPVEWYAEHLEQLANELETRAMVRSSAALDERDRAIRGTYGDAAAMLRRYADEVREAVREY